MGIHDWSEDTILVDLSKEPEMGNELITVMEMVRDRGDCTNLSRLLKLRKKLFDSGHKLVLCSVSAATKGIFMITGLDGNFEFANDKSEVLASL
jgi:hypothetical protein